MGPSSEPPSTSGSQTAPDAAGDTTDLTGRTLGDFYILRRLGQGGMGQVYLAEQISLKRKVALKLLRADLAANATSLQRFKTEATAVARATHANIVQVYFIGETDGMYYMALEYVEGRNLRQYLEKKGPPEVLLALSIMRQVAAALQRASELGIIHRDIKPENILVTRKGEVKVADFGLSRCFAETDQPLHLTQSGVTMGTPLYMSPEQVEGKPIDPRTDIYSFGVTCYHLLAGEPPFRGQSAFEVAVQHVQKEPTPLAEIRPDLPRELAAIVHKMMAKKPEDRFQTGREVVREIGRLRDALVGVTGGIPTSALLTMGPGPAQPSDAVSTQTAVPIPRRRRWALWGALVLLLSVGVGLGLGWWRNAGRLPASPPPAPVGDDPFAGASREKFLREAVKQPTNPKEPREVRQGLEFRIDLGLLYLKERRLDEAEEFFKGLQKEDTIEQYRALGLLGEAMVLAFRDEAKESVALFEKVAILGKNPKKMAALPGGFWYAHGPLREMMAEALNHNYANWTGPRAFPRALDLLRRPPTPVLGKSKGKSI
jgi:serine/threonine-protein kinase